VRQGVAVPDHAQPIRSARARKGESVDVRRASSFSRLVVRRSAAILILLAAFVGIAQAVPMKSTYPSFYDGFNGSGAVREVGPEYQSGSAYWWLSSGGMLYQRERVGQTIQGELPYSDPLRQGYARANPTDTDDGRRPQNIFRLHTREKWKTFRQEVFFSVRATSTSKSWNRNASNGVLLFSRYVDANNTYYAGLRVDGGVVIKKKKAGKYSTLAFRSWFGNRYDYDRTHRPNLLPRYEWLGIRTEILDLASGGTRIRLYVSEGFGKRWDLALEALDTSGGSDGPPITSAGRAGIRSDFMDLSFENYRAEALY
jgi:hypothetical protein